MEFAGVGHDGKGGWHWWLLFCYHWHPEQGNCFCETAFLCVCRAVRGEVLSCEVRYALSFSFGLKDGSFEPKATWLEYLTETDGLHSPNWLHSLEQQCVKETLKPRWCNTTGMTRQWSESNMKLSTHFCTYLSLIGRIWADQVAKRKQNSQEWEWLSRKWAKWHRLTLQKNGCGSNEPNNNKSFFFLGWWRKWARRSASWQEHRKFITLPCCT